MLSGDDKVSIFYINGCPIEKKLDRIGYRSSPKFKLRSSFNYRPDNIPSSCRYMPKLNRPDRGSASSQ